MQDDDKHIETDDTEPDAGSTQYKPGQTGNRRGRPRKKLFSSTEAMVRASLDKTIKVKIDGKVVTMTRREAAMEKAVNDVIAGKRGAIKYLQDLMAMPSMRPIDPDDDDYITHTFRRSDLIRAADLLAKSKEAGF